MLCFENWNAKKRIPPMKSEIFTSAVYKNILFKTIIIFKKNIAIGQRFIIQIKTIIS